MGYGSRAKRYYASAKRKYRRVDKWSRTPQTPRQLAVQAYRGVKYLKGLVNSEMLHNAITGSTSLNNGSTPTVINITSLAQGDTVSGRTGNSILFRGLMCRFQFIHNNSATNILYRVMLVQDNQTVADETTLATSDILDSNSTLAPISVANAGRFKILKNWYFGTSSASNTQKVLQYYRKFYHHVRYNGAAATDIQKGAIFLVAFSDNSVNQPTFAYNIKTSYHDN